MKLVLKAKKEHGKWVVESKGDMPVELGALLLVQWMQRRSLPPMIRDSPPYQWRNVYHAITHPELFDYDFTEEWRYAIMSLHRAGEK